MSGPFDVLSDDEFAAEVQRRLARGTMGFDGLLSPHQMNYRACWAGICEAISDLSNRDFDHPHVRRLRERMYELADGARLPSLNVFAINTTFHGRDPYQDHAPRRELAA